MDVEQPQPQPQPQVQFRSESQSGIGASTSTSSTSNGSSGSNGSGDSGTSTSTKDSPWWPLDGTVVPYLRRHYGVNRIGEINPVAKLKPVYENVRVLRVRWKLELVGTLRDLELIQWKEFATSGGGVDRLPRKVGEEFDATAVRNLKRVYVRALDTDSEYASMIETLKESGFDVGGVNVGQIGIQSVSSTFPTNIGISIHLVPPEDTVASADGSLTEAQDRSLHRPHWHAMGRGYVCHLRPSEPPNGLKLQHSVYPMQVNDLPGPDGVTPNRVVGKTPMVSGRKKNQDQMYMVMNTGKAMDQHCTYLGNIKPSQLTAGCIVLPPHPDPAYSGPAVPLTQQYVLIPPAHVLGVACTAKDETRVARINLNPAQRADGRPLPAQAQHMLLAVPGDLVASASEDLEYSTMSEIEMQMADLEALSIGINAANAPNFALNEVSREDWGKRGALKMQLELLVYVYHRDIRENPFSAPLVPV